MKKRNPTQKKAAQESNKVVVKPNEQHASWMDDGQRSNVGPVGDSL